MIQNILQDVEKGIEYGPALQEQVTDTFAKTISRPLTKETAKNLKDAVKIPETLKQLVPPKMNVEMWKLLPSHARVDDLKKQQIQNSVAYGVSAFSQIANIIATRSQELPKDVKAAILKLSVDGANILGNELQEVNLRRRSNVKRYINPQFHGVCSLNAGPGEWLFGNDLSESLKSSKASSALALPNRGFRFNPYQRQNSTRPASGSNYQQPLNWNRQSFQAPRRSNWGGRGANSGSRFSRPSYFQNQNQFNKRI